jgi:hypothetical protein
MLRAHSDISQQTPPEARLECLRSVPTTGGTQTRMRWRSQIRLECLRKCTTAVFSLKVESMVFLWRQ